MPDEPLHQPHDSIFKWTFRQVETAAAVFRAFLPQSLTRHLDLQRAELVPGSFVDEQLKTRLSDLLFKVPVHGGEILVYLLFEHQSREDYWTALRLLGYMVRIWEHWRRDQPPGKALPVIVPVVLSQQSANWRQEPTFGALFDLLPELRSAYSSALPDFTFTLIELTKLPYDKIVGTPMGIMTLRVLKAQPSKALLSDEVWDEPLLSQLTPVELDVVLRYILALGEIDRVKFADRLGQLRGTELRRNAMTLAEQFIQQGREEGLEKGLEKGMVIGQIRLLQSLHGRAETPVGELAKRSLGELDEIYSELRQASR